MINLTPKSYGISELINGNYEIRVPHGLKTLPRGVMFNFKHDGEIYTPYNIETGRSEGDTNIYFECKKNEKTKNR